MKLIFKKGQKEGLAGYKWSPLTYCSIQEQLSIAINEHLFYSVSLVWRFICFTMVQCCRPLLVPLSAGGEEF